RGTWADQRKREAGERDGARRRSHAPASTGRGLRLSRPTFWSSLAFGSLRETCLLGFARLRLPARNLPSGLRSPSARCAKLAFWSSLAFGSLPETCLLGVAPLRLAGANLTLGRRPAS